MRHVQRSAFGLIFGTGLAVSSATAGVACGNKDYNDCEATRTCETPGSSNGASGAGGSSNTGRVTSAAGAPDDDSHTAASGKGGSAGAGANPAQGNTGGSGANGGTGHGTDTGEGGEAGEDGEHHGVGGALAHAGGKGGTGGGPASAGQPSSGGQAQGGVGGQAQAAAGGHDDAGHAGMTGGAGGPPRDTTPPSIVAVSPANATTGIRSDAVITVTFSEPMNTLSAQQAYASSDLPPDALDASWNLNDTALTLRPKAPLTYADLTDPTAGAKHYSFTISGTAKDLAGNSIGTDQSFEFTTLRQVTQVLQVESSGGLVVTESTSGDVSSKATCDKVGSYVTAGDDSHDGSIFSLVTFDLSSLPSGIVEWQSAIFTGSYSTTQLIPFGDSRLGSLHLFSTAITPTALNWDSDMTDMGVFGKWASQVDGSVDVTEAVAGDYTLGSRSEYVLHFDDATDDNAAASYATLYCSDLRLTVDYLVP